MRNRILRSTPYLAALAALPVALVGMTAAAPALASVASHTPVVAPGRIHCNVGGTFAFSPALRTDGRQERTKVTGKLSDCTTTGAGVSITSGKLSGTFASVPFTCTTSCTGTDAPADLTVAWKGKDAGVKARFAPSRIVGNGSTAFELTSGNVGFYVPGPDNSSSVTGSFAGNGSFLDLGTLDPAQIEAAEAAKKGLKKLVVDGSLTLRDITAYVAEYGAQAVVPIDTLTNTAGTAIPVGGTAYHIAVDPDGAHAYVSNTSGTVVPIDTFTNTADSPITVSGDPWGIAITPNGETAYVADITTASVVPIDLISGAVGTPISLGEGADPDGIAITPDGSTAYVTNDVDPYLYPIDLATNTAGTPIDVGEPGELDAITPNGATVYVGTIRDDEVIPVSTATNTPGAPITVGSQDDTCCLAISPDSSTVYTVNYGGAFIAVIATATDTVETEITTDVLMWGIAVTPNGKTLYVPNNDGGTVIPIPTATDTPGTAITVGDSSSEPRNIAIG